MYNTGRKTVPITTHLLNVSASLLRGQRKRHPLKERSKITCSVRQDELSASVMKRGCCQKHVLPFSVAAGKGKRECVLEDCKKFR